jgi:hypothetical protein
LFCHIFWYFGDQFRIVLKFAHKIQ